MLLWRKQTLVFIFYQNVITNSSASVMTLLFQIISLSALIFLSLQPPVAFHEPINSWLIFQLTFFFWKCGITQWELQNIQKFVKTEILSVKFDNSTCMCFQHINLKNIHLMLVRIFWKLLPSCGLGKFLLHCFNFVVARTRFTKWGVRPQSHKSANESGKFCEGFTDSVQMKEHSQLISIKTKSNCNSHVTWPKNENCLIIT